MLIALKARWGLRAGSSRRCAPHDDSRFLDVETGKARILFLQKAFPSLGLL